MQCLFLTQASAKIGLGHLMRCLALSQYMFENHIDATFLLDEETAKIARQRHDWTAKVIAHDYCVPVEEQINKFQVCVSGKPDWIIIDGYQFSQSFISAWQATGSKVAVFDDGINDNPLVADQLIVGKDYRLLRKEFWTIPKLSIPERQSLTVCMGGSDPMHITIPVLQKLENSNFSGPIRVVTGQAYPWLRELQQQIAKSHLAIQHIHAAQDMAAIWSNARLALSAAGGSQFELGVCETPSILVVVADNQKQATEQAQKEGWCEVVEYQSNADINKIVAMIEMLWRDEQKLEQMQRNLIGRYDVHGGDKLLDLLANTSEKNE